MKQEIFRFYFEPEKYFGTGYKVGLKQFSDVPHSPLRCPTQEQVIEAKRIGQKFRLWLILHPDYFGWELKSFESPLFVWTIVNKTDEPIHFYNRVMAKMCDLCPFGTNVLECPDVQPVFFGRGDVRFVDAKIYSHFMAFPCLEWVKHV